MVELALIFALTLHVTSWLLVALAFVLVFVLLFICLRKGFRQLLFNKSQTLETWLPVVDEVGGVIGKVAQSVSQETPGVYQHPLVRILVWYDGKLFLQPRSEQSVFEPHKMDHPLEYLLKFGENIDGTLATCCKQFLPGVDSPRFLLKYKHVNQEGRWLVLLYMATLKDAAQLSGIHPELGKLWTLKQVEANQGKSFFSSLFEEEIHFFKSFLQAKKPTAHAL